MKTIIVIGALLLLVSPIFPACHAGNKDVDRKQIYELKEKCAKSTERYFYEISKGSNDPELKDAHLSHMTQSYNSRLNTCLADEWWVYSGTNKRSLIVRDILTGRIMAFCNETKGFYSVEKNLLKSFDECIKKAEQLMDE
jgi:hypothetical protein